MEDPFIIFREVVRLVGLVRVEAVGCHGLVHTAQTISSQRGRGIRPPSPGH